MSKTKNYIMQKEIDDLKACDEQAERDDFFINWIMSECNCSRKEAIKRYESKEE